MLKNKSNYIIPLQQKPLLFSKNIATRDTIQGFIRDKKKKYYYNI